MMESKPLSLDGFGLEDIGFLLRGTTIIMVKCIDGIVVAADGLTFKILPDKEADAKQKKSDAQDTRAFKIEYIGNPPFMLAASSGTTAWFLSVLDLLNSEMNEEEWTIEKCAEFAKTELSKNSFTPPPNCKIPDDINIMDFGCTILFARYAAMPSRPASLFPRIFLARRNDFKSVEEPYICIGTGSTFAEPFLEGKDFTKWKREDVIRLLEEIMVYTSKKDVRTGGDIGIYCISSNNSITPVYVPFKSVELLELEQKRDKERREMAEAGRATKRTRKNWSF